MASAIIGAIPQTFKVVDGIRQNREANRLMDENVRPEYEIPNEVKQALEIARVMASRNKMPGQEILENQIQGQLGNQVRDIKDLSVSSGQALNAAANAYAGQQNRLQDLGVQSARNKQELEAVLMAKLEGIAQYQDKEFKMNEMDPYLDAAMTASALKQSGLTNIYSGFEGIGRVGSQAYMASNLNQGKMNINDASGTRGTGDLGGSKAMNENDFWNNLSPEAKQYLQVINFTY